MSLPRLERWGPYGIPTAGTSRNFTLPITAAPATEWGWALFVVKPPLFGELVVHARRQQQGLLNFLKHCCKPPYRTGAQGSVAAVAWASGHAERAGRALRDKRRRGPYGIPAPGASTLSYNTSPRPLELGIC